MFLWNQTAFASNFGVGVNTITIEWQNVKEYRPKMVKISNYYLHYFETDKLF